MLVKVISFPVRCKCINHLCDLVNTAGSTSLVSGAAPAGDDSTMLDGTVGEDLIMKDLPLETSGEFGVHQVN